MNAMRAAIYLRISDDPNDTQKGVARQREDCIALCKAKGWDYTLYEDNDVSATKKNVVRKEYQRMLKDIEAGKIQAIVPWHTDRLYRTLTDLLPLIELCVAKNVPIAGVQTGEIDLSTDAGRLIAKILGAVAENEVERKTARQLRAFKQMAQDGKGWGPRQFGYNGDHEDPQLVMNEAAGIAQAYSDVLNQKTLRSIARDWNAKNLRTTKGNLWDSGRVGRVLRNPRNAGLRAHNGVVIGQGDWPAIVDRDTWDAVQFILGRPERITHQHTGGSARKRLLGGILRCGECGDGLASAVRNKEIHTYRCKHVECGKVSRRTDKMDEWVRELIIRRLRAASEWAPEVEDKRNMMKALTDQAKALNQRLDSLAVDFADGVLTSSQMRTASERIREQLNHTETEIRELSSTNVLDPLLHAPDPGAAFDELALEQKRTVITRLIDRIVVHRLGKGSWSKPTGTGIDIHWRELEPDPELVEH